jgi:hypothetical protein
MSAYIGIPGILTFAAMSVIFGFLWRLAAIRLADTPVGKAMAFIN